MCYPGETFDRSARLCDDDGMVRGEYLYHHNWLAQSAVTEPFACTSHAHLGGEHVQCTSPAHSTFTICADGVIRPKTPLLDALGFGTPSDGKRVLGVYGGITIVSDPTMPDGMAEMRGHRDVVTIVGLTA